MSASANLSLTQRAYRCLKCLYLLSNANIGEIIHEADITAGPGEPRLEIIHVLGSEQLCASDFGYSRDTCKNRT